MYTVRNFKSKKELKAAVQTWNEFAALPAEQIDAIVKSAGEGKGPPPPPAVRYFQPGPYGGNEPRNGSFAVEGPHYPQPHKWYAEVTAENGMIVKVK
jgi:hypothetical protein